MQMFPTNCVGLYILVIHTLLHVLYVTTGWYGSMMALQLVKD